MAINGIFEPFKDFVKNQIEERNDVKLSRTPQKFPSYFVGKQCYLRKALEER